MYNRIIASIILTATLGCARPLIVHPPYNIEDFYPKPICSQYDATGAKQIKSLIPPYTLDNVVAEFTVYSTSDVFDGYNVRAYNSGSKHKQKITLSELEQKEEFLREGKFNILEIRKNDQFNSEPLAYIYRTESYTYILFDLEKSDGPELALCFKFWNPSFVPETAKMILEKRILDTLRNNGLIPPFLLGPRKIGL